MSTHTKSPNLILRFRRSERSLHWAIAIPFLACWTSAAILVFLYNPMPTREYRDILSWFHRISGICFIILPPLAVIKNHRDFRMHFVNIKQAWIWTISDFKWLTRMGFAMIFKGIRLPEQGKFNAAEKLNFMLVMTTYPLYILTGLLMWFTHANWTAWIFHFFMAFIATPFLLGHLFMALVNKDTRVGLQGMLSGYVDRTWAKHHYGRWYREQVEEDAEEAQLELWDQE